MLCDNLHFFNSFSGQLCPMVTSEVEALNANLSMLEGESENYLFWVLLHLPSHSGALQVCSAPALPSAS